MAKLPEGHYDGLPEGLRDGVKRYIEHHIPPGGFLEAVISNQLSEAFGRADEQNRRRLYEIVGWFYNYAPSTCWGSPEKYQIWLKAGNLVRRRNPANLDYMAMTTVVFILMEMALRGSSSQASDNIVEEIGIFFKNAVQYTDSSQYEMLMEIFTTEATHGPYIDRLGGVTPLVQRVFATLDEICDCHPQVKMDIEEAIRRAEE